MALLRKNLSLIFGCVLAAAMGALMYSALFSALEPKVNSKILFWFGGFLTLASAALDRARQVFGDSLSSAALEDRTRRDLKLRLDELLKEMAVRRLISFSGLLTSTFIGIVLESTSVSITLYFPVLASVAYALAAVGILNILIVLYEQRWLVSLGVAIKSAELAAKARADTLQQLGGLK